MGWDGQHHDDLRLRHGYQLGPIHMRRARPAKLPSPIGHFGATEQQISPSVALTRHAVAPARTRGCFRPIRSPMRSMAPTLISAWRDPPEVSLTRQYRSTIAISNNINDGIGGPVRVQQPWCKHAHPVGRQRGYSGGTTLSAGVVQINNANSLGSGTVTFNGGTLQGDGGPTVQSRSPTQCRLPQTVAPSTPAPTTSTLPAT